MHTSLSQIGLVSLLLTVNGWAQQTASEYQVKAAYLYNFAKASEWPSQFVPAADSTLVLCVVGGEDDFVKVLRETLAGKTVKSHPIEIRQAHSPEELKFCQVAFIRGSERKPRAIISALDKSGVLLVGEDGDFLNQGGMINLTLIDGRINFEVNSASLQHAGIRFGPNSSTAAKGEAAPSSAQSESSRSRKLGTAPPYPEIARRMGLKGAVQLQAMVRPDGTVKEVHVIGGHPVLAQAAMQAVMGWRYEPASKETLEVVKIDFGQ